MENRKATGRFQRQRTRGLTAEEDEKTELTGRDSRNFRFPTHAPSFLRRRPMIARKRTRASGSFGDLEGCSSSISRWWSGHKARALSRNWTPPSRLYLRCAGYTQSDAANEIFRHTPAPRDRTAPKTLTTAADWQATLSAWRATSTLLPSRPRRSRLRRSRKRRRKVTVTSYRRWIVQRLVWGNVLLYLPSLLGKIQKWCI